MDLLNSGYINFSFMMIAETLYVVPYGMQETLSNVKNFIITCMWTLRGM